MAERKACGCKGIRCCLQCEGGEKAPSSSGVQHFLLCILCGETVLSAGAGEDCKHHVKLEQNIPSLKGITVVRNFVSEEEENGIVTEIDKTVWSKSQSGRRKQVGGRSWQGKPPGTRKLCLFSHIKFWHILNFYLQVRDCLVG